MSTAAADVATKVIPAPAPAVAAKPGIPAVVTPPKVEPVKAVSAPASAPAAAPVAAAPAAEPVDPTKAGTAVSDPPDSTAVTAPAPEVKPEVKPVEIKVELPKDSLLAAEFAEKTAAYSRERGFSQEQAQELANWGSKSVSDFMAESRTAYDRTVNEWAEQCKAHSEFGGKRYAESSERARRFVNRFGDDAIKKALNETGYGNHPALFAMLARAGYAQADDKTVPGGQPPAGKPKSIAERLYGKTGAPEPQASQA
jgi:hypothetical protein